MKESSRALALAALQRWRNGSQFADQIVAQMFASSGLIPADRAFALELFYGLLRNLTLLDFWIGELRSARVAPNARDLLRLGLYQVLLLETAAHAAVFETVELAGKRTRPLINAVLRRALREKEALTTAAEAQPFAVRFSIPPFLIEKWSRQFSDEELLALCRWNNQPAPVYARVNQLRLTVPEFLTRYPESRLLAGSANFVSLPHPGPALQEGDCYVQDPSTGLACALLRPAPGDRVLDACAAPGGKTAYLAELMQNQGRLVAADQGEERLARLRGNLVRLGVQAVETVRCDWLEPGMAQAAGWDGPTFDKILLDAPCTNTGVLRRRVDLRWRLRPDDFARVPQQQLAILRAVAPLLRPGGSLVYSTCSLEPEENDEVVAAFLQAHPGFRLTSTQESLPFRDGYDGAYVARLERS